MHFLLWMVRSFFITTDSQRCFITPWQLFLLATLWGGAGAPLLVRAHCSSVVANVYMLYAAVPNRAPTRFACNIEMDIGVLKTCPQCPHVGCWVSQCRQTQKLTLVRSHPVQRVQALSIRVPGNVSTVCTATTGRGQHVHGRFSARWSTATLFVSGLTLFRRNVPLLLWLCLSSKITTYGPFQFLFVRPPEKHCVCWTTQGHWCPQDKDCRNYAADNAVDADRIVEQFSVVL